MEIEIGGIIIEEEIEIGGIEMDIQKVYPELENLEITPSGIEQNFKSEKYYGYNNVKVKEVESDTLDVIPTEENQQITGLFGIVNVNKIPEKYVVPKVIENTLILSRGEVEGGVISL